MYLVAMDETLAGVGKKVKKAIVATVLKKN